MAKPHGMCSLCIRLQCSLCSSVCNGSSSIGWPGSWSAALSTEPAVRIRGFELTNLLLVQGLMSLDHGAPVEDVAFLPSGDCPCSS